MRTSVRTSVTCVALCAVAWSALGHQSADDELAERLASVAEAARAEFELAGLAVGLSLGGEPLLAAGWGYADASSETAADAESSFRAGALTPALITLGLALLAEEGGFAYEDRLGEHLDGLEGELADLTVEQLLRHTSGLPPVDGDFDGAGELSAWIAAQPLEHEPGSCAVYSGANTYLAGRLLEALSGSTVPELIDARIAEPLALAATRYCSDGPPLRETAEPVQEYGSDSVLDPVLASSFGAPGLCSSAEDGLALLAALAERELVSDASLERLLEPAPLADGTEVGFVGGFSLRNLEGHRVLSFGGGLAGGSVHLAWYPDLDLSVALFASSEDASLGPLERRLARAFLGKAGPGLDELPLPSERIERYPGSYFVGCLRFEVTARDGHLWIEPSTGSEIRLLHQGEHAFVALEDPDLRVTFEADEGLARSLSFDDHGLVTVATRLE